MAFLLFFFRGQRYLLISAKPAWRQDDGTVDGLLVTGCFLLAFMLFFPESVADSFCVEVVWMA